jgi:hypothetical protein
MDCSGERRRGRNSRTGNEETRFVRAPRDGAGTIPPRLASVIDSAPVINTQGCSYAVSVV